MRFYSPSISEVSVLHAPCMFFQHTQLRLRVKIRPTLQEAQSCSQCRHFLDVKDKHHLCFCCLDMDHFREVVSGSDVHCTDWAAMDGAKRGCQTHANEKINNDMPGSIYGHRRPGKNVNQKQETSTISGGPTHA